MVGNGFKVFNWRLSCTFPTKPINGVLYAKIAIDAWHILSKTCILTMVKYFVLFKLYKCIANCSENSKTIYSSKIGFWQVFKSPN